MKNRKNLYISLVILFSLVLVQIPVFFVPATLTTVYYNIIRPICYLVVLALAITLLGFGFVYNRNKQTSLAILLFGSVIYVALLFAAALITSLGKNPMTSSISAVLGNVWQYIPFVIAGEIIRFLVVRHTTAKHRLPMIFLTTLVLSFTMLDLKNAAFTFEFLMVHLLPIVSVNFFITYVCTNGSLAGIICFRAAYSLIPIFMPILPNITGILLAILTYCAIIVMFAVYDKLLPKEDQKVPFKTKTPRFAFLAPLLILLVFVMSFGLFSSNLVAVASNSMKGEFSRGDVVVMKSLTTEEAKTTLKEGDIVQFKSGNIYIIHRIIEITCDYDSEIQYITKGDNNEAADSSPVLPSQIVGVARFSIRYFGYPSVLLMELFT